MSWDNRKALHRHARYALEDFETLRTLLNINPRSGYLRSKLLHAISHHLRHTVYRSGVEINWGKPVRRSHQ